MATGFNKNYNGVTLVPQNTTVPSTDGDLRYNSATNKAELFNGAVDPIVTEADTATLTNKTLTGNTAANLVNGSGTFDFNSSGTITAPNGTDTLVGQSLTQTLTNKTLSGNTATNLVNGSGTFDFNSTGTITAPNGTDTLAGVALTQTLTNKTIAAGSNTITGLTNTNLSGTAAITNANLAQMAAGTVKANTTGSSATPADVSVASIVVAGGGVTSVGTLDSEATPSANAITIASGAITAQSASATAPGVVNTTTQTFAGAKTFSTSVSSPAITGSSSVTSPSYTVTGTGGNVSIGPASGTTTTYSVALPAAQGLTNTTLQNDGSGNLTWQPAGAGSGSKNYLGVVNGANNNGNFELGTTTGWSTFGTTLTGVIPTGTIGAVGSGVTFGVTSLAANVLGGSYSGIVSSSGAFPAGSGLISNSFTIDQEDQAKVLTFKFYYKNAFSTSYVNFSGTSSNTFAVYIYDVTNSAWIQPAGVYSMTQTSGVGYATGTFQTTSNSTQYRLAIVAVNASTGTGSIYVDDFFCGPQTAPLGPALGDFTNESSLFSFNGMGTPTNVAVYDRRVGDSLEVYGSLSIGTPSASTVSIQLPSKYAINSSKLTTTANAQIVGKVALAFNGGPAAFTAATTGVSEIFYDGSTTNQLFIAYQYSTNTIVKVAGTTLFNVAGNVVTFHFTVPIQGWSSNLSMSNDTDTRVVAAFANTLSSTTGTSGTAIVYTSVSSDSAGAYSSANGKYTCPVSGYYLVSSFVPAISSGSATIFVSQNGAAYSNAARILDIDTSKGVNGSLLMKCNAGDTLAVTPNASVTFSNTAGNVSFQRLSGPSVIAATESVNARYVSSTSSVSSSYSTVVFSTKDYDSHNAYNSTTGIYTVPVSGKYLINSKLLITATTAHQTSMQIAKNGTGVSQNYGPVNYTANFGYDTSVVDQINLLAGDQIAIQALDSGTSPSISSTATRCVFSIARVGN